MIMIRNREKVGNAEHINLKIMHTNTTPTYMKRRKNLFPGCLAITQVQETTYITNDHTLRMMQQEWSNLTISLVSKSHQLVSRFLASGH